MSFIDLVRRTRECHQCEQGVVGEVVRLPSYCIVVLASERRAGVLHLVDEGSGLASIGLPLAFDDQAPTPKSAAE